VKPDVIYHLASDSRAARDIEMVPITFHANLASAVNVLTSATECDCDRIVIAGSQEEPHPDEIGAVPSSPYAAAKWGATQYARMFRKLYNAPVANLRIFMVYGPEQKDLGKLIPSVILKLLAGEAPIINSGKRGVDWIYCDDVVEALLAAGSKKEADGLEVYVGSGELVTIRDIVDLLVEKINPSLQAIYRDRARPHEQEVVANPAATLRARSRLGWSPQVTLSEGLDRTIQWCKDIHQRD
jgi:nucleoside-diphosphate-sugar epimerase